jgi:hypothetical protein
MKTLITALAVTAILATPAIAKTQRTKEVRIQPTPSRGSTLRTAASNMGSTILIIESVSSLCATAETTKAAR